MRLRSYWQIVVFGVWAVAAVLAGSILTSFHQAFALPSGGILSIATEKHGWRAVHLLGTGCACSQKVSDYLAKRTPLNGIAEEVIFIGAADPFGNREALLARGLRAKSIQEDDLQAYSVKGVPLLVFISPADEIVYMGGYGAGGFRDVSIWEQVRAGGAVTPLPVLGCAMGERLRRKIDFLSWKSAPIADEGKQGR